MCYAEMPQIIACWFSGKYGSYPGLEAGFAETLPRTSRNNSRLPLYGVYPYSTDKFAAFSLLVDSIGIFSVLSEKKWRWSILVKISLKCVGSTTTGSFQNWFDQTHFGQYPPTPSLEHSPHILQAYLPLHGETVQPGSEKQRSSTAL